MENWTIDVDRWATMPLFEQMANIGSEVGRARKWLEKGKQQLAEGAFYRGLELVDATIRFGRSNMASRTCLLMELCRARDLFSDSFLKRDYDSLGYLEKYFGQFASAIRR
ncbi:MAG: hypothetical protein MJY61_02745 [Bacteroidales bacterium]|nr:hypothetical protein [Bacteroidales bacterium]